MVPSKRFASRSFGSLLRTASQVSFAPSKAFEFELRVPDSAQADSPPLEILLHLARQQPQVTASMVSGVAFNLFTEVEWHGQKFYRVLRAQVRKGQEDRTIGLIRVNCPTDGFNERFEA